jgi:hypothetical protein
MAVLVSFHVPAATLDQVYAVEALTQARGEAAGGPPYAGCMFFAATVADDGMRVVSAWSTENHFWSVMDEMLGPDLATQQLAAVDVAVSPVVSMAIPGAHAP